MGAERPANQRERSLQGWMRRHLAVTPAPGESAAAPAPEDEPAGPEAVRVLLIALDAQPLRELSDELVGSGFAVRLAADAAEAEEIIAHQSISLIVVAGRRVTNTCRNLRQVTSAPILALLPETAEDDVLDAFAAGADDCQSAIIGAREVSLRLGAMLRRARGGRS